MSAAPCIRAVAQHADPSLVRILPTAVRTCPSIGSLEGSRPIGRDGAVFKYGGGKVKPGNLAHVCDHLLHLLGENHGFYTNISCPLCRTCELIIVNHLPSKFHDVREIRSYHHGSNAATRRGRPISTSCWPSPEGRPSQFHESIDSQSSSCDGQCCFSRNRYIAPLSTALHQEVHQPSTRPRRL